MRIDTNGLNYMYVYFNRKDRMDASIDECFGQGIARIRKEISSSAMRIRNDTELELQSKSARAYQTNKVQVTDGFDLMISQLDTAHVNRTNRLSAKSHELSIREQAAIDRICENLGKKDKLRCNLQSKIHATMARIRNARREVTKTERLNMKSFQVSFRNREETACKNLERELKVIRKILALGEKVSQIRTLRILSVVNQHMQTTCTFQEESIDVLKATTNFHDRNLQTFRRRRLFESQHIMSRSSSFENNVRDQSSQLIRKHSLILDTTLGSIERVLSDFVLLRETQNRLVQSCQVKSHLDVVCAEEDESTYENTALLYKSAVKSCVDTFIVLENIDQEYDRRTVVLTQPILHHINLCQEETRERQKFEQLMEDKRSAKLELERIVEMNHVLSQKNELRCLKIKKKLSDCKNLKREISALKKKLNETKASTMPSKRADQTTVRCQTGDGLSNKQIELPPQGSRPRTSGALAFGVIGKSGAWDTSPQF